MLRRSSAPLLSPEGLRDLLPQISLALTALGLVLSLAAGLTSSGSDDSHVFDCPDPDAPAYEVPGPEDAERLEEIRVDIDTAVRELRQKESVPPVVMDPVRLQRGAQRWAECSAASGRQSNSPADVTMLQHHLPVQNASGHAFLDAWLHSQPHTDVILDERYVFYGIGVAQGHGEVWVTLQFSAR